MDFFEEQHRARQRTGWLIVLFGLAVCGTVIAVYAALKIALYSALDVPFDQLSGRFWDGALFWRVAAYTVALIAAASLYKIRAVSASAESVVLGLGGRLVDSNADDPYERRLLNVVEEMAIASGVPVPAVYVLPAEPGINALAVGLDVSRSAIAVTDGCLKLLSRDELQGVVAHEFSHLLNGDSRINLRLLGLVHGILVIGLIGSMLLRSLGRSNDSGKRSKSSGSALSALLFVGASLYVIGYVGVFFTRLIKAAVSRQRELLADASGVQFTRNPAGLAGALKKIGGLDRGSRLLAARAEEASHFYFSDGMGRLIVLMSTHPPLAERIRFLDPTFQGEMPATPRGDRQRRRAERSAHRLCSVPAGAHSAAPPGFHSGALGRKGGGAGAAARREPGDEGGAVEGSAGAGGSAARGPRVARIHCPAHRSGGSAAADPRPRAAGVATAVQRAVRRAPRGRRSADSRRLPHRPLRVHAAMRAGAPPGPALRAGACGTGGGPADRGSRCALGAALDAGLRRRRGSGGGRARLRGGARAAVGGSLLPRAASAGQARPA